MDESFLIHGEVEQECAVMTHAAVVQVGELWDAFYTGILALVIEPTRTDTGVALRGYPGIAIGMSAGQLVVLIVTRINLVDSQERPVGGIGIALLVANPTATGAAIAKDDGLWLMLIHQFVGTGEIVVGTAINLALLLGTAIPAITTVGTIEPHLEKLAILGEQLLELGIEILHIEWGAVECLMAIPWREVQTQFQAVLLTGGCQLAYNIALTILVRRIANAVVGVLGGPQTKTVVVLGGEYHTFHTGSLDGAGPLLGIKLGGVEITQWRIAIAPLAIAKGVGTEVDKSISL